MADGGEAEEADVDDAARRLGVDLRSLTQDGTGWRLRGRWRGIGIGAWNDMDGVAVVADIGPWDEWVGLRGHPPDPTPVEALEWLRVTLELWLADPDHASRVAARPGGDG